MASADHWIEGLHKGGLHKSLGIKAGNPIPKAKIMKATHADNPKTAKQARAAEVLERLRRRCDGGPV